jgi:hypothetical protein
LNTELEGLLCDSEAARLLPWYLTGRLAAAETGRVAQHIDQCAICREDLADQQALRSRMRADGNVEMAPQSGLAATLARIDELDRELGRDHGAAARATAMAPAAAIRNEAQPLRRQRRLTRWLAAAVIVQAIGLALSGRALLTQSQGVLPGEAGSADYHTLSSAGPAVSGARIRVVFAPSMTTDALRALLRAQHLEIVAGPSEAGVFTLGLEAGAGSTAAALQVLRADPLVRFSEPAAADALIRP